MITYLIDENMPFLSFWNAERFVHVTELPLFILIQIFGNMLLHMIL